MGNEKQVEFEYPSAKGFEVSETVTIPITNKIDREIDDTHYKKERANKADVESWVESSTLPNAQAKTFVDENHYKTIITTQNSWMDPDTGRVVLFEAPRTAQRLA